jgi:hypothetical protein
VCTNTDLERRIILEVGFSTARGQNYSLAPELLQHLAECESCSKWLPIWAEKGAATYQTLQADEIVRLGMAGHPGIRKKRLKAGTGFFRPFEDATGRGLFVVVRETAPLELRRMEVMTIDSFERLDESAFPTK